MKSVFKLLSYLLSFLFFVSCSGIPEEQPDYILNIDVVDIDTSMILSEILEDDYEFVALESGPEYTMGNISKVHITNDAIYVLDAFMSKTLYKFDRQGNYIFSFGKSDSDGGSYSTPFDFVFDEDSKHVFILESGNYILEYDENGHFLDAVNIVDLGYSAFLFEKTKTGFAFISGRTEDDLVLANNKFQKIKSYFPFENNSLDKVLINPIQNIEDSIVVFMRFLNDQIFRIERNNLIPHVYLNFNHSYPPALFKENIRKSEFDKVLKDSGVSVLKLYFENAKSICFTFSIRNKPYLGFYNKVSNQLKFSSYAYYINDITFDYRSSYVIGTFENRFVFYVQPQHLMDGLNRESEKYMNSTSYLKAMEISKSLSSRSNPVLLIAGVKDSIW